MMLPSHKEKKKEKESSCYSTPLPEFCVVSVLDFSHSNWCVSLWYFDLQFLNACSASFHMLNCHLYILLCKVSVYIFFKKKIRLYDFLLSSFKIFWYILDKSFIRYIFCKYYLQIWFVFSYWQCFSQSRILKFWWNTTYPLFLAWIKLLVLYLKSCC